MSNNNDDNFNPSTQSLARENKKRNDTLSKDTNGLPDQETANDNVNLEDAFGQLFKSSVSGTGEEELLRIASDYALQIKARQIRLLLFILHKASAFNLASQFNSNTIKKKQYAYASSYLKEFVANWLEYKKHNNSDIFVMRALDSISLRKFINENTLKVNIEK